MTVIPFNNEEYEKAILGMMIINGEIIDLFPTNFSVDCFYTPRNKFVFKQLCEMWKKDKNIDYSVLTKDSEEAKYIAELTNLNSSVSSWKFYVTKLIKLHNSWQLRQKLLSSAEKITPDNFEDISSDVESEITSCSVSSVENYEMKNLAISVVEDIQKAAMSKKELTGFASGFEQLDNILDGFQKETMYVIGARPSIGKTAFALAITQGIAERGNRVAMFSLEMSAKSLFFRMLSAKTDIPMWQIRKGLVNESKNLILRCNHGIEQLWALPINTYDTGVDNDKTLYQKIRFEVKVNHTEVIVIDHLGLIEVSDSSGQRYVDVGRITKTLHKMAKELKVCIIVLAQCGREAEGKKPNLALLRESGNIEQDGDVIMLLHRQRELDDEKEKENPLKEFPTDVIVAKNRDGGTGTATFSFKPICMRFREDNNRSALDDLGARNEKVKQQERKHEEIRY